MLTTTHTIQNLKINMSDVLFFDMDGTLVETDFANYLSYKKAIQKVIQSDIDIPYNPSERFNRQVLKRMFSHFSNSEYDEIIELKNALYKEHLSHTKQNDVIVELLKKHFKTHKTVLVTNCQKERAIMTLEYHQLIDYFCEKFYMFEIENHISKNKFKHALTHLKIHPSSVIVFENDANEMKNAILAGIDKNNIIIFPFLK
ncbi:MAG: HAD family hydrolase [Tannerellaceae bacterium]|nr:HAD family hydrolase [Tannerellaceae bacterium]